MDVDEAEPTVTNTSRACSTQRWPHGQRRYRTTPSDVRCVDSIRAVAEGTPQAAHAFMGPSVL